jgi:hypothetical protein
MIHLLWMVLEIVGFDFSLNKHRSMEPILVPSLCHFMSSFQMIRLDRSGGFRGEAMGAIASPLKSYIPHCSIETRMN